MNAPAPKTSPDTALGNLMAAALDVPAAPEQPAVPDDTLARTGNTADHQAGWFAGMEQGQANAQANMAIRPPSRDWKAIQVAIDDYLDGYELRADEGAHTPTDFERFLLDDCIAGLLAEDDILALLAGAAAPAAGDALDKHATHSMQPVATAFFTEKGEVAYTGIFDRTLKALESVKTTRMGISSGSIDLYAGRACAPAAGDAPAIVLPAKMPKHESDGGEYPSSDSYQEGYAEGWNDAIDAARAAQRKGDA